jgi:hypothetical protein
MDDEVVQHLLRTPVPERLPQVRGDCKFHIYCSPHDPGGVAQQLAEKLSSTYLPQLKWTAEPEQLPQCEHMLIVLTAETWSLGNKSNQFAHEVCTAMRCGVHRLLVHEVPGARLGDNEARHAIAFGEIKAMTPAHLHMLYSEIAQNLGGGEWRDSGLAKMALELAKNSKKRDYWRYDVLEPGWQRSVRNPTSRRRAFGSSSFRSSPFSPLKSVRTRLLNAQSVPRETVVEEELCVEKVAKDRHGRRVTLRHEQQEVARERESRRATHVHERL